MAEYLLLSAVPVMKRWEQMGSMQKDGVEVGGWVTRKTILQSKTAAEALKPKIKQN